MGNDRFFICPPVHIYVLLKEFPFYIRYFVYGPLLLFLKYSLNVFICALAYTLLLFWRDRREKEWMRRELSIKGHMEILWESMVVLLLYLKRCIYHTAYSIYVTSNVLSFPPPFSLPPSHRQLNSSCFLLSFSTCASNKKTMCVSLLSIILCISI